MSITPIDLNIRNKLKDKRYFNQHFHRLVQDFIAMEIKALREKRNLRQADLAALTGMKQSAISRIEQARYGSASLRTLIRLAGALDARLQVTFTPAEEVIRQYEDRGI